MFHSYCKNSSWILLHKLFFIPDSRSSRKLYVDSSSSTPDTVQEEQISLRSLDEETTIYHYVKNSSPLNVR